MQAYAKLSPAGKLHRLRGLAIAALAHCDLQSPRIVYHKFDTNLLYQLHRDRLHPIDFEDTVWGFRSHDIAMAMLDLLETTGEAGYPGLLAVFRRGCQAHMAWPDDPIEPCQIGRLRWKINWVARRQPQWLARIIERHVPAFEHYEQTGGQAPAGMMVV